MLVDPASVPTAVPDPVTPALGDLLVSAWESGALQAALDVSPGAATPPVGPVRAELAGVGESFAAWRLAPLPSMPSAPTAMTRPTAPTGKTAPTGPASFILRVPHVPVSALPRSLAQEIAALAHAPTGVGPAPVGAHDDASTSPLGLPVVLTADVPGAAARPSSWTSAHLRSHAHHLARLHSVPAPGRGPVMPGPEPWAAVPAGPQSLLTEVEAEAEGWRAAVIGAPDVSGLEPLIDAALARVARIEPQIAQLDGFVLSHGDLCATNILWDGVNVAGRPAVQYIDFEWAQGDDPARDLAIIGGAVHGGPWYVPLTEEQVAGFVGAYVDARAALAREAGSGELPDSVADVGALRERMRAWTAYDRMAMLAHVASRAAESEMHRRVLPQLRGTLAAELGLPD